MSFFAMGAGIGTKNSKGNWLETYFSVPVFSPAESFIEKVGALVDYKDGNQTFELDSPTCHALEALCIKEELTAHAINFAVMECSNQPRNLVILQTDEPAKSTPEAYLKLHLLSHRFLKPHQIDLSHIFEVLPNVAWTNKGAIDIHELPEHQLLSRARGEKLLVDSVDKFPRMTDYVVPEGVRIADTSRVRLGAYIGTGTTVMHEGFVNFNAGSEGPSMIEGRISAGVFVGKGSDLGGGCSTMGTLSGGNSAVISVGEECLIGANAGIGISLGNRCTVEAGLYITAGSKITLLNDNNQAVNSVVARELSGKNDLLFRRNSISGAIECLINASAIELNESLHTHN